MPDRPTRPDLGPVPPLRLLWLGVFAVLRALGLLLVAEAVARGISGVQAGALDARAVVLLGVAGAMLRSLAGWATQVTAQRVAISVKRDLRARLWRRIADGGAGGAERQGGLVVLASEGLDDLDDYYTQSLPSMIGAVVIPLVIGLRILGADWVSALIVALTVPLVPVFMILIGRHTQERTDEATGALTRLADHLSELARGLPVLVGLGRVQEQTRSLDRIQREYRERTLATLRTAFLSALALELIATLSVAVVAVFLGLRLLYDTVSLEPALLALILAPEIYAALRDVGTAFHASQSGLSALARVRAMLGRRAASDVRGASEARTDARSRTVERADRGVGGPMIRVDGLTVRYAGRTEAVLSGVDASLRGIVAVTGPSGAGKSTLLAALSGSLPDEAELTGSVTGVDPAAVAWSPQAPRAFGATPRDELSLYGAADPLAALAELGLEGVADAAVPELSPGEQRRLSVARALARVDAGATLLVLDEPTAHLDAVSADRVRDAIRRRAERATVVLATHEPETLALADSIVPVRGHGAFDEGDALRHERRRPAAAAAPGQRRDDLRASDAAAESPGSQPSDLGTQPPPRAFRDASVPDGAHPDRRAPQATATPGRLLASILRPARWRWLAAILLGVVATGMGLALTGISGWLIVRASEEQHIMYLLVAIVGVRFFGIGRSVGRYAERLATHDAAFRVIDALRLRLWGAIAARGAGSRRLLEGGSPVDYLVTQADELRDQLPRVLAPLAVGVLSLLAITVTTALVAPPLTLVVGTALTLAAALGAALAVVAARGAGSAGVHERAAVVRGTAALSDAAGDLRGNGEAPVRAALGRLDATAERLAHAERTAAWGAGAGSAVAVLVTSLLAALVAVLAPDLLAQDLAVIALLALAALEPLDGLIRAVHRLPVLRAALARLGPVLHPAPPALAGDREPGCARSLGRGVRRAVPRGRPRLRPRRDRRRHGRVARAGGAQRVGQVDPPVRPHGCAPRIDRRGPRRRRAAARPRRGVVAAAGGVVPPGGLRVRFDAARQPAARARPGRLPVRRRDAPRAGARRPRRAARYAARRARHARRARGLGAVGRRAPAARRRARPAQPRGRPAARRADGPPRCPDGRRDDGRHPPRVGRPHHGARLAPTRRRARRRPRRPPRLSPSVGAPPARRRKNGGAARGMSPIRASRRASPRGASGRASKEAPRGGPKVRPCGARGDGRAWRRPPRGG
nr:ABC transporter transmembrane domain-containing protein [Microbacterium sp. Marseille-Q6965]